MKVGVAVGAESEGDVEQLRVAKRLLHAGADSVIVVLGLNDGAREPDLW